MALSVDSWTGTSTQTGLAMCPEGEQLDQQRQCVLSRRLCDKYGHKRDTAVQSHQVVARSTVRVPAVENARGDVRQLAA